MKKRTGMKIRWKGEDGYQGLSYGEVYTLRSEKDEQCRIYEDGDEEYFYPMQFFEIVDVKPGMKVRWLGESDWLMLTNGQAYTVLSVEKGWYRVIDNSGEDYLYPPEFFEIVEDG